jgi:hypothetical protein
METFKLHTSDLAVFMCIRLLDANVEIALSMRRDVISGERNNYGNDTNFPYHDFTTRNSIQHINQALALMNIIGDNDVNLNIVIGAFHVNIRTSRDVVVVHSKTTKIVLGSTPDLRKSLQIFLIEYRDYCVRNQVNG